MKAIDENKVYGDICEVMAGKKAKRESKEEIVVYSPRGYRRGRRLG